MKTRLVATVAVLAAVGAAHTPALAGKKPKPITGSYRATATPDPTSTSQVDNSQCKPTVPTGKDSHPFTVPAAGTLTVKLANKLDWSLAIRDAQGNTLASADGGLPNDAETTLATFKRKTKITIDACNFAGEPQVGVSYVFTYK